MKKSIKIKKLIIIMLFLGMIIISNNVFATENEEKLEEKFDLRDSINITVKNQRTTNNCWIMPVTTAFETNLALKNDKNIVISARHLDYSTSQTFKDGAVNKFGLIRQVNTSGTAEWALAYLTNGSGPILEEDMPYTEQFEEMDLAEFQRYKSILKLEDWVMFPRIYKSVNEGQLIYLDKEDNVYTTTEVEEIRKTLKEHIKENGAIYAELNITGTDKYYNKENSAYCCMDEDINSDHAVSIIGWDDTFSKDNFNEANKPEKDGAYIVLNSYGLDDEIPSVFYVSYEDRNIEKILYGIEKIGKKDYSKIYQYDELGRNSAISLGNVKEVYGANVYDRPLQKREYLTEVTIATYIGVSCEVYVNAESGEINSRKLVKVAETAENLTNGYHTIKLAEPILLTGTKFVVAVKYKADEEVLLATTTNFKYSDGSTPYANVTSNKGESFYGVSLDEMKDLYDVEELKDTSLCIKALTYVIGDISQDGKLSALDISLLKMYLVHLIELNEGALKMADVSQDGRVTVLDLSILKKMLIE